jgi:hypothetical protein
MGIERNQRFLFWPNARFHDEITAIVLTNPTTVAGYPRSGFSPKDVMSVRSLWIDGGAWAYGWSLKSCFKYFSRAASSLGTARKAATSVLRTSCSHFAHWDGSCRKVICPGFAGLP